jgi:predicted dehydrogenase
MVKFRFAVVGAGGFAFFAVSEFIKTPGVTLVGVYDPVVQNGLKFKEISDGVTMYSSFEDLLGDRTVDLVYIATPPSLHYEQSKQALLSGKHVICEKPAATKLEQAVELKEIANQKRLLFVVNLMQRYNFLYDLIKDTIDARVLGDFLRGFFENYASDESLNETHWFWDKEKSGGIFIEHGVHFFDMFSGWFGSGRFLDSQILARPGFSGITDRVQATFLYGGALVNFYHGFDQPKIMDRQELRLQFERGEITLYDWVPTRLTMTAICTAEDFAFFKSKFRAANIRVLEAFDSPKIVQGRFKEIAISYKIVVETIDTVQKQDLYQYLVKSMFQDQLDWIHNPAHTRRITEDNAVTSLAMAVEADNNAILIYP